MAATNDTSSRPSVLGIVTALMRRMMITPAQRARVGIAAALEGLGILLGIAGPYALKILVDGLDADTLSPEQMGLCVVTFALSWSGATICASARLVFSTRLIDEMTGTIVRDVLASRLPTAASARDGDSGRTLGIIERLPYSLLVVVDGLIWRFVPLVIQVVATFAILAGLVPWHYVVVLTSILVVYVAISRLGAETHQGLSNQANAAAGAVSQNTGDVLRNARRVVLNGALDVELDGIARGYLEKARAYQALTVSLVGLSAIQYGGLSLGLLCLILIAGFDVLGHRLTVGDFVLLQAYALRLIVPLSGFAFVLTQSAVALANIRDVFGLTFDQHEAGRADTQIVGAASVYLSNVSFRYGPGLPGLVDVTIEIPAGTFTVIVGPNGSGKSTLAQIMAGILEPTSGTVRVGGTDISEVPRTERHKLVLYVPQFIGLFNRTLGANALYPPTLQTEEDIAGLLSKWQFYEAGRSIDFGASVGEQGERLSGGQVQKLELARIAGVKGPLVILDESTSELDPASEAAVIAELRQRFGGKTTMVLITHHEGVAGAADQVLFLKDGRLLRRGKHVDLLADSVMYARLWKVK